MIVHADDFGLHPAINDGIERAHCEGLVSSASVMPLGPAFADALRRLPLLPGLDLGLHFALVGVPQMPPTLGAFLSLYARGQLPASLVETRLRRQMNALSSLEISHIDSHQHLHALPSIMRVVCRVAAENGIGAIRLPLDGPAYDAVPPARRVQAAALAAMARLSRHYVAAYGLCTSDHFSGMAVSGHLTAPALAAYLKNARPGLTEIVCHPGADNSALSQAFPWGYNWQGEMTALCSPEARAAVTENTVALTNWRSRHQST